MMLKNVVDRAVEAGSFKTLTKALAAAGLVETLTRRAVHRLLRPLGTMPSPSCQRGR